MNNLTEKNKNTDERFIDLPNRLITYQCNNCKEYVESYRLNFDFQEKSWLCSNCNTSQRSLITVLDESGLYSKVE